MFNNTPGNGAGRNALPGDHSLWVKNSVLAYTHPFSQKKQSGMPRQDRRSLSLLVHAGMLASSLMLVGNAWADTTPTGTSSHRHHAQASTKGGSHDAVAPAAPAAPAAAAASTSTTSTASTQHLQNVTVTGSAIPRADEETAEPVTVYNADQLRSEGITSVDQFMQRLSVNSSTAGNGLGTGTFANYTGGGSTASMRGLGGDKTLILLNGRRLPASASNGEATNLNTIPFNAIKRIEILRDGGSALYGSDAIAGVINFITKSNLQGGNLEVQGSTPTKSGGGQNQGYTGSWGYGDLDKQGFNIMGIVSYNKQNALGLRHRQFYNQVSNPYFPPPYSTYNSPANINQGQNIAASSLTSCANGVSYQGSCQYDTRKIGDAVNHREDTLTYTVGTFKINDHTTGALSYFWDRDKNRENWQPYQPGSTNKQGLEVDPSSPFYPGNSEGPNAPGWLNPSEPVYAEYLASPLGPERLLDTNDEKRLMFELKGDALGWTYDSAATYGVSRFHEDFEGSWLNDDALQKAVDDGQFNPFESPNARDMNALRQARVHGLAQYGVVKDYSIDGNAHRTIGNWFGAGPVAVAVGADATHEKYTTGVTHQIGNVPGSGLDPNSSMSADRTNEGAFGQIDLPVVNSLEFTGSVRYDHYSKIGGSVNPKISFRYQPIQSLVFRGSYGTGFEAPSLTDLYSPPAFTYGPSGNDPELCPGGIPKPGVNVSQACDVGFRQLQSGSKNLKPAKSKNYSLGFVFEPVTGWETTADLWWINIKNDFGTENTPYILQHDPNAIHRNPKTGYISYLDNPTQNVAKERTNGVDVGTNYTWDMYGTWNFALNGTYVNQFKEQESQDAPWQSEVGNMLGEVPRWKHSATLSWHRSGWYASVTNNFFSKLNDYNPGGEAKRHKTVASYTTWDLALGYHFRNGLKIDVGSQNVFNRHPPFNDYDGSDPRFYSLVGRTLYTNVNFVF